MPMKPCSNCPLIQRTKPIRVALRPHLTINQRRTAKFLALAPCPFDHRWAKTLTGWGTGDCATGYPAAGNKRKGLLMRKSLFLVIGIAIAFVVGSGTSQAQTKSYWDQSQRKFVEYDSRGLMNRGGKRIKRKDIRYDGPYRANTIVIKTSERRLFHIYEDGKASRYGIGVGRQGFAWSGENRISRKAEWPGWTPPPEMIARERAVGRILRAYMEGGINNPLGARALYIGSTLYRIHGTREPWTIGQAVSSGCIRLTNDDIVHLYDRVKVGTKVVVLP